MYGTYLPEGGPIATSISIEKNKNILVLDSIKEVIKPEIKFDTNFGIDISLFSKKAIFSQRIKINQSVKTDIKGTIVYMACDDHRCLPPKEKNFIIPVNLPANNTRNNIIVNQKITDSSNISTKKDSLQEQYLVKAESKFLSTSPTIDHSSLIHFILIAFLAGLAGILTPCVFPMIPMTITFFLKGSENKIKAIMKGMVFGISIIMLYTLIGVVVSLTSIGAGFANQFSTHWLSNIIFFILFFVFAASFFGMFELVLPSGLINKADRRADKGGYLGVFFMALVTVLVSFSCTGPIVGALLVEAASGEALKPILGMFSFAVAFALPFTLFAIFPSALQNLPKSGSWLNSVKIVLGFIILAFSLKFIVNIDQTYHLNFISRDVFISIWIIISVFLGFYLLGKIKFANDSELQYVSFPRMLLAMASFSFSIYLVTGFLGSPLSSISAIMPPQRYAVTPSSTINAKSKLCGMPKYSDILHLPYNLEGYFDFKEGLECSQKANKPIFLDFNGHACSNCKAFEAKVWSDPEVLRYLNDNFVIISLYVDDRTKLDKKNWEISKFDGKTKKTLGQVNSNLQIELFKTNTQPFYIISDEKGNPLLPPYNNKIDVQSFFDYLKKGVEIFNRSK
jgi:thiol:disulfide interchange protein DsbD